MTVEPLSDTSHKSDFRLLSENGVEKEVRSKLLSNWVVVFGCADLVQKFEQEVYPAGTPASADFAAIFGPNLFGDQKLGILYLAKKTFRLFKFLSGYQRSSPDLRRDFDALVILRLFHLKGEEFCASELICLKPDRNPEQEISNLVSRLFNRGV